LIAIALVAFCRPLARSGVSRERLVESTSLATLVTFALVNLSLLRIAMKLDVRGLIDPDGFEYLPRSFARGAICAGLGLDHLFDLAQCVPAAIERIL
jgi:hypothetical protein